MGYSSEVKVETELSPSNRPKTGPPLFLCVSLLLIRVPTPVFSARERDAALSQAVGPASRAGESVVSNGTPGSEGEEEEEEAIYLTLSASSARALLTKRLLFLVDDGHPHPTRRLGLPRNINMRVLRKRGSIFESPRQPMAGGECRRSPSLPPPQSGSILSALRSHIRSGIVLSAAFWKEPAKSSCA